MKKLSVLFFIFFFSCSLAEFSNAPTYKFGDLIKSFSINNKVARFEDNKIFLKLDADTDLSKLVAVFKTEILTKVYVDGTEQISGLTINDFSKGRLVYSAINPTINKEETYYVFVSKIILVDEFSNMIKVKSINNNLVNFDFLKAPSQDLIGVDEDEITYCTAKHKIENIFTHSDTNLIDNFECDNFLPYKNINKSIKLLDETYIFNIVAKHNNKLYYYQRLFIDKDAEILFNDTIYDSIENKIIIGNGNNINLLNTEGITDSIIINATLNMQKTEAVIFSSIENCIINSRITDLMTDSNFINNIVIDYKDYEGVQQGIIAGLLINNFLLTSLFKNNIIIGKINSGQLVGGIVGFAIGSGLFDNNIIEVSLPENGFCIYGEKIDNQILIDNIELCTY